MKLKFVETPVNFLLILFLAKIVNLIHAMGGVKSADSWAERIVEMPKRYNALSHFEASELVARDFKVLWQPSESQVYFKTFVRIKLNDTEAWQLDASLKALVGSEFGSVSNSDVISHAKHKKHKKHKRHKASPTAAPTALYLQTIPNCGAQLQNYSVALLDGYVYDSPALKGVVIRNVTNIAGATPGKMNHGMYTAQILGGSAGVIPYSGISIYNYVIFGDDGTASVANVIYALGLAATLNEQLQKLGITLGVNFSGYTQYDNTPLNLAFQQSSLAMPTSVAVGNFGTSCIGSPADAGANVIPVGSTENTNGALPARWSNWGCGSRMFFVPGEILCHLYNSAKKTTYFDGTSGSAPLLLRMLFYYMAANKKTSYPQIIDTLFDATVQISPPIDSQVKSMMSVFPAQNGCPSFLRNSI